MPVACRLTFHRRAIHSSVSRNHLQPLILPCCPASLHRPVLYANAGPTSPTFPLSHLSPRLFYHALSQCPLNDNRHDPLVGQSRQINTTISPLFEPINTTIDLPARQLLRDALLRAAKNGTAPRYTFKLHASYPTPLQDRSRGDRLMIILADALDALQPNNEKHHPDITLPDEHHEILRHAGYEFNDLTTWLEILTKPNSQDASHLFPDPHPASTPATHPPPFVYLHFLNRAYISPAALHNLVNYLPAWYSLCRQQNSHNYSFKNVITSSFSLLPHARACLPHVLPTIVTSFLQLLHDVRLESQQDDQPAKHHRRVAVITALLNRALALVAIPCKLEPFKNAVYQEFAQADILTFMAEHDPPLTITREGYRAVTRVQLAQPKTDDEKLWARLKSPSWPPWKEDRTGLDAIIGIEHGISRARRVLDRSQEAGYPKQEWDAAALIHSGWDTDGSPTIQARTFMYTPNKRHVHDSLVWISRIRSVRTVQQAWACFLSYTDAKLPLGQDIYLAMFEKILMEYKRQQMAGHPRLHHLADDPHHQKPLYPGDVMEVFPPPPSTHQATYTRIPPPTFRELHTHMVDHGLAPAGQTLAFLLSHSNSLEEGLHFLESAGGDYKTRLLPLMRDMRAFDSRPDLSFMPNRVFAALITLLGRFPHFKLKEQRQDKLWYNGVRIDCRRPLSVALYLLKVDARPYLPAWTALIRSHARNHGPDLVARWEFKNNNVWDGDENSLAEEDRSALVKLVGFRHLRHLLMCIKKLDMSLDAKTFRYVCIIIEHAAVAATQMVNKYKPVSSDIAEAKSIKPTAPAEKMAQLYKSALKMQGDSAWVCDQFWAFVGEESRPSQQQDQSTASPKLLVIPSFAVVHSYIRALGFLGEYQGLHDVTRWMRAHWDQLSTRLEMDRNGSESFRRCIVALRVFLERRLDAEIGKVGEHDFVDREKMLKCVREVVESQEWHEWPSDDEVAEYITWNS